MDITFSNLNNFEIAKIASDCLLTHVIIGPAQGEKNSTLFGFQPAEISALGAMFTTLISLLLAIHTIKKYSADKRDEQNSKLLERKISEAKAAQEKIEKFYGPFNALLEESRVIYEHFAINEKEKSKQSGSYFRTLPYLIKINSHENTEFDEHDKQLLSQIIGISDSIVKLIETNSGFVDNPELHTLLGKLIAHYRILKCAADGKLNKNDSNLDDIVFPLEINGALENEIRKLKKTINFHKTNKNKININKSIRYYDNNYIEYFKKTYSIDMSDVYLRVRQHFKRGTFVLDAGCGVGRDTQYFIKHGYKVTSFDASQKMVDLCNQYPFAFCERLDFNEIDFPSKFDLVWACASLLHLNESEFKNAIYRLYKSMRHGAIIYFSLKNHPKKDKKRDFYHYDDEKIDDLFIVDLGMSKVDCWDTISNMQEANDTFKNYIFRKQ